MHGNDDSEMPPGSDRQWWLTAGPELCFVCEAPVHPELLTYCVACDHVMCSLCLYEVAGPGEVLCPGCMAEEREST